MASSALGTWTGERAERLDELLDAHSRVGGTSPGRRWRTEQLNWSLILRLAAEFQGYCRDLHDEGARIFARTVAGTNAALEVSIYRLMSLNRVIDRGNAREQAIADAFGRFGLDWWTALERADPRTSKARTTLRLLNRARNAIAHDNLSDLDALRKQGTPVGLAMFRRWRRDVATLAQAMDAGLAAHLSILLGTRAPW